MKNLKLSNVARFLATFMLLFLLPACATVGRGFDLGSVATVRVGETTMSEVRSQFGSPTTEIDVATWDYKRMHFGDETTRTIWRYLYAKGTIGSARSKFLQVDFDESGRVADYYYSSSFKGDKTESAAKRDFDIFLAKERIVEGTTSKPEVLSLLGDSYRVIPINKPGTAERWHYGFSAKSADETTTMHTSAGAVTIDKIYGKSLDIDFDSRGIVCDIRGESDFPADKDRFFTTGK